MLQKGFLCVCLTVWKLALLTRLALNSETPVPLLRECCDEGMHALPLPS